MFSLSPLFLLCLWYTTIVFQRSEICGHTCTPGSAGRCAPQKERSKHCMQFQRPQHKKIYRLLTYSTHTGKAPTMHVNFFPPIIYVNCWKLALWDTARQIKISVCMNQQRRNHYCHCRPVIFGTVLALVLAMSRFFQSISQGQRHQNLLSRSLCCLKYKASSHLRNKFRSYIRL